MMSGNLIVLVRRFSRSLLSDIFQHAVGLLARPWSLLHPVSASLSMSCSEFVTFIAPHPHLAHIHGLGRVRASSLLVEHILTEKLPSISWSLQTLSSSLEFLNELFTPT